MRYIILVAMVLMSNAQANADDQDVGVDVPCFVEGQLNLVFSGTPENGYINGWIGTEALNMNVFGGHADGYLKGEPINFNITGDAAFGNYRLEGWIRGQYMRWSIFAGRVTGFVNCIP